MRRWVRAGGLSTLVFFLPTIIVFALFSWWPILRSLPLSMEQTNFISTQWVWFDNFGKVLSDPLLPTAVLNTTWFTLLALVIGVWQLGEKLTGRPLDGVCDCAFPRPAYPVPSDRLRFDRPVHRLVFPASVLELPLVTADAAAKRLAADQLERELAQLSDGLVGKIRAHLAKHDAPPTIVELARTLKLSPRTLKRRLAEDGTTYSALRDDQRRQRALLLLDDRSLSISEIAVRLGYTELPNFTRAFRTWTGMTPAAYRGLTVRPRAAP